ncbi:MAG: hypothetical protein C0603_00625 [Denitrovibrio sp.]|nr:MAG: hypothetical protein C0603_00625 [Denitrovibrio sp.]
MNINVAVMAGGQSRRFQTDKTIEQFDGKPLIQHAVDNLANIADDIIVVAKDCTKYLFLNIECVTDAYEVQCPMVGILTALKHFDTPIFVVAADVPFVSSNHVKKLYNALGDNHAAMPDVDNKQHPLYACYNTSIIEALEECVGAEKYGLMKAMQRLNVNYLSEKKLFDSENDKKCFININTREDYNLAKKYTGVSDD